jgi:coiled-coil domain-containing protein 77
MTLPKDLPLSVDLLNYYRERIGLTNCNHQSDGVEKAEQDYQESLQAVDAIKISHDEYHKLTWELHQRMNEIAELQKALSDAQAFLFEERRQLLKAMAENDELRGTPLFIDWYNHSAQCRN